MAPIDREATKQNRPANLPVSQVTATGATPVHIPAVILTLLLICVSALEQQRRNSPLRGKVPVHDYFPLYLTKMLMSLCPAKCLMQKAASPANLQQGAC